MADVAPTPSLAAALAAPLPRGWVRRFATGFTFPFRGFWFLWRAPGLIPLAIMPATLNFLLAVGGLVLAFVFAPDVLSGFWDRPEAHDLITRGLSVLWVVVVVLIGLVLATLWLVLVYACAGLIATPFTDYLTEQVERRALTLADEDFRIARFLRDVTWSVIHSLLNVVAWATVMAPLGLVNFIPGIGTVLFGILSGTATAFFLAREMMDGCMTRRRLGWFAKQRLVLRNAPLTLGFGLGTMVLFWVPGINLVLLPFTHIGGALLYARLVHAGLAPRERG
jgi:CysZ protein